MRPLRFLPLLTLPLLACAGERRAPESPGAASPAPAPEPAPEPAPASASDGGPPAPARSFDTPEACAQEGGRFVASTGGAAECPPGTSEVGTVRFGIEGGVCCR